MTAAGEGCGALLGRTPFACDRPPHWPDPRHSIALVFPEGPAEVEWWDLPDWWEVIRWDEPFSPGWGLADGPDSWVPDSGVS